jgi:hypothetical protein
VYEVADGHPKLEAMVRTATWAATAERSAGYIKEQKIAQTVHEIAEQNVLVDINECTIPAPCVFLFAQTL